MLRQGTDFSRAIRPSPYPVCHPDRSGRFLPPLANVSTGRAVEGSWLDLSTGTVVGNISLLLRPSVALSVYPDYCRDRFRSTGAAAVHERDRTKTGSYKWCGSFLPAPGAGGSGTALCAGFVSVVPWIFVEGAVAANVGRLCARTCVAASKPEASLMSVGSLNAVPKKLIPIGAPNTMAAGTCTIGYPSAAARLDVPKIKWSPKIKSVDHAGLSVAVTTASRLNWLSAASMPFTPKAWSSASAWL